MNKEQAQIYIDNGGDGYKHMPWGMQFLFVGVVSLVGILSIFMARSRAINIATFIVTVAELLSTCISVRKYMSYRRSLILGSIHLFMITVALDIAVAAVAIYAGILAAWWLCLSIGLQVAVFVVTCVLTVWRAKYAKRRKAVIVSGSIAPGISVFALCTFNLVFKAAKPNKTVVGIIVIVCFLICAVVLFACCAMIFSAVGIMIKHKINYLPKQRSLDDFCVLMIASGTPAYALFGLKYNDYKVFVSSRRRGRLVMTVYRGRKRLQKDMFYDVADFAQKACIRGERISEIWERVEQV